jgi:hypothetical protein
VLLASPSESVIESAAAVVRATLDTTAKVGKGGHLSGWANAAISAANLRPSAPRDWQPNLAKAADDWVTAARAANPKTVGALATATDALTKALADARSGIAAAKADRGASPRIASRSVDALAEAVARQLEDMETGLGAAGVASLKTKIQGLRDAIPPTAVATEPYDRYWSNAKTAAKKTLTGTESSKLDKWFGQGLSPALVAWKKQIDAVPNHNHDELLKQSWAIANALNRYRVGLLKIVSDPAARAPLFDAIDALATAVSGTLQAKKALYGNRL